MRYDPARAARRALLGLVLLVSLAVAWSLLRPKPAPAPPRPGATPGAGTTVGDMSFLRFEDQSRKIAVKAREAIRQSGDTMLMRGVEAVMPFVNEGRSGTLTIRAEECQYQPGMERAAFKGKVELRTDDGFELDSDTLKYWGDKQRAFTRDPLQFKRGSMSGSAIGLEYNPGEELRLLDSVRVRIEDPAGAPAEIESESASVSRDKHVLLFAGAVRARQAARELKSDSLRLDMSEGMDEVEKATATGSVELVTGPGAALPGGGAASGGTKRLRGQRLEALFRAKGILQEALATDAASLEVEPGPLEAPERRRVTAPRLRFEFDEQGALVAVHALGPAGTRARTPASRLAVLTAEPITPGQGSPRRVESETLDATLDPATGAPKGAEFKGAVVFSEPGRKAFASQASYDDVAGSLLLTGEPRIVDEGEGSELRAQTIRIGTRTRAVTAHGSVRHSVARRGGGGALPGMFGGQQPTVFVCRDFEFDPDTRTARYQENAMARSGTDEVRAPLITLVDPGPGQRRMTATGGTSSVLHPRPAKDATKEPAPVDARSKEMVYEEAAGRVVYTGEVEIRQGDILTKSPIATAVLTKDGDALEQLVAEQKVEVHQGQKHANGERGVYTPSNETFVLTGENVVLLDGDRRLRGRILTFESGSDRIRVDGRDEMRPEGIFKRKEPPKP